MFNNPIIQGGMGIGVSNSTLAGAVSRAGQVGVVSGTALDVVLARRLQLGDSAGNLRRAMEYFPDQGIIRRILDKYFIPGGKGENTPFRSTPVATLPLARELLELTVTANFVEVFLAKENHGGQIGINYLEKVQLMTLPSLFGAMLAGVGCVLMGAGIPRAIPGTLDRFVEGSAVEIPIAVPKHGQGVTTRFDPREFFGQAPPPMERPNFLAIVSSGTLATMLTRKANGRVDGFVVEGSTAGGHNAPPRGSKSLSATGEPIYGDRDKVDLEVFQRLGLPFWLAGSYGHPGGLAAALKAGANGIQVGTAFALCEESGIARELKKKVIEGIVKGCMPLKTDAKASPAGFPFKILQMQGSLSDPGVHGIRRRVCDLGYLRHAYPAPGGAHGWRCPAEPGGDYERKGGLPDDTVERLCICNGLMATIGLGQIRHDGQQEAPLVTLGNDLAGIERFLGKDRRSYLAKDVINVLLKG